jgi:hypothetical protein
MMTFIDFDNSCLTFPGEHQEVLCYVLRAKLATSLATLNPIAADLRSIKPSKPCRVHTCFCWIISVDRI